MKNRILTALIILLATGACAKPPVYQPRNPKEDSVDPLVKKVDNKINGVQSFVKDTFLGLQCNAKDPKGFRAWRRLSNVEFKNTVASVFSTTDIDYSGLPDDITRLEVYDTMMVPLNFVDAQRFRAYRLIAKAVAAKVDLAKLFPCLKDGAGCISKIIPDLGSAAWRRPLSAEETTKLTAIYTASVPEIGSDDSARLLVLALMLSESFIYRSELGIKSTDDTYILTDWEMASALSYTILRQPPDAALRELAANKGLNSDEAIERQVTRLLADPRAKDAWKEFASMWLDSRAVLDVERPTSKDFTAELKKKTAAEVGDLFSEIMNRPTGSSLEALFNADSIPSLTPSPIYDAMPTAGRIQFKEPQRRGVLGQGSFLVSTSSVTDTSPVKRGAFVIERLLCTGFAPAPVIMLPERVPGESNRDRYLKLGTLPGCANCHNSMNQLGFVFDNFDQLGKFRTEVDGEKIKVEAEVNIDAKMVTVRSAAELSAAIAKSDQGRECFARHIFRYSLGRHEFAPHPIIGASVDKMVLVTNQADADSCQLKSLTDAMTENNGDIKAPIIKLLTSSSFRQRINRSAEP